MSGEDAVVQPFSATLGQPPPPPPAAAELLAGGPLLAIHRGIEARLKQAFPERQFSHKAFRARLTPAEWERVTERTPAVGLGWVKMTPSGSPRGHIWSGSGHWTVFLIARNPRTDASPVLGDALGGAVGAGLMGMVAVAVSALHGCNIAGLGSATVGEAGEAYSDTWARADMALAALNVTVPFDLVDAAGLAGLEAFLLLGVRWPGVPDQVVDMADDGDVPLSASEGMAA